jgi:hypothetical protein
VVQIRTHAQKYFQKLAKARQNGEEGDVAMEGRGGTAVVPSVTASAAQSSKRRRQTSGTKRKAIQSVVSSAQRQGKKLAAAQVASGVPCPTAPLPAVAPALAHYVLPSSQPPHPDVQPTQPCVPSITTAQGTISGPALEDSLYVPRPLFFLFVLRLTFVSLYNATAFDSSLQLQSFHQNHNSMKLRAKQVLIQLRSLRISLARRLPQEEGRFRRPV